MLRRRIQQARGGGRGGLPPFPGHGRRVELYVHACFSAEVSQSATGGGVKLRFTRNLKRVNER
jgi:hypothetical protein